MKYHELLDCKKIRRLSWADELYLKSVNGFRKWNDGRFYCGSTIAMKANDWIEIKEEEFKPLSEKRLWGSNQYVESDIIEANKEYIKRLNDIVYHRTLEVIDIDNNAREIYGNRLI